MCKGKGVVTLRATLVHIDDEDCVSAGPDVTDTPSKCEMWGGHTGFVKGLTHDGKKFVLTFAQLCEKLKKKKMKGWLR